MDEIWKPIGIGDNMVSNFGNVKNGDKLRKPQIVGNGHCQLAIRHNGECKYYYIHRLVGEHFLEKPSAEKCLIDHIDRNKTNNHVNNLRWCTHQENSNNRYDSREPTEKVLKQRERCRAYKLANPEKIKAYQNKFVSNGGKNKLAKANREQSKQEMMRDIYLANWRRAMAKVHFIIKLKKISENNI
jgi:hypothetical protein